MKHMKKLFSMVLAMALALSMGIGAMAAGDGSITINDTVEGKTYTAYKLFDATGSGDAIAYTATEAVKTGMEAIEDCGTYFTFTKNAAGTAYVVGRAEGSDDTALTQWLTANSAALAAIEGITSKGVSTTGTTTEITGLDYGYYFVTTTNGAAVMVTTAAPAVTIVDKNEGPGWDPDPKDPTPDDNDLGKFIVLDKGETTESAVKADDVNVGDVVDYRINVGAADYNVEGTTTKQITEYTITDTLPTGFTLNGDFTVSVDGTDLTDEQFSVSTEGQKSTITIANWDTLAAKTATISKHKVVISYSATIGADANLEGEANTNTATMTWTYADGTTPQDPPEDVHADTYSYKITIDKYDSANEATKLAGVEFELHKGTDTLNLVDLGESTYRLATADDAEIVTTVVTDTNGAVVIKGLEKGDYTLVETKTNDGYNLLTEPVVVAIAGNEEAAFNANQIAKVANSTGTVLPSTGGIGTTIFYVVGGLLIVGAGVLLITKKRAATK